MVRVIHHLRGRARFEVPGLRRCRALAAHLEEELRGACGVRRISASPLTGTVLIFFFEPQSVGAMAARIDAIRSSFLQRVPDASTDRSSSPEDSSVSSLHNERGCGWVSPSRDARHELEEPTTSWHTMEPDEVLHRLETSFETGLSEAAFQRQWSRHGPNRLPGTLTRSLVEIVTSQVNSSPVLLTAGAAALSLVTGGVLEGLLALGVAALNVAVGTFTEARAEKILSVVRQAVSLRAHVLREGHVEEVSFDAIVPGDILELQSGYRVPADARLIRSDLLSVAEAALTGESVPVSKMSARIADEDAPISERWNMVYRGTLVVEGTGYAVVVATGKETVLGQLQIFLGEVFPPEALMVRAMRNIAGHLLRLGGSASCVFALITLLKGHGPARALQESLAFIAGTLPSGLSTIAVGAFALGHRDLRRNRILVHRLRALGSLASIQVVCFDKTGTLTMNRMMARELRAGGRNVEIQSSWFDAEEGEHLVFQEPDITRLVTIAALCNEATLTEQDGQPSIEGSSTEKALLQLAAHAGIDAAALRTEYPLFYTRPRTEERPFMITVHGTGNNGKLLAMKGSPLDVLDRCTHTLRDGQVVPLTEHGRQEIEEENVTMAGSGLRVLGAAFRESHSRGDSVTLRAPMRFVWVGLIGLADPVRKGAASLIQSLHNLGIQTAVITGDQSPTARHIGEELRLSGDDPLRILDATDLQGLSAAGLRSVVTQAHVFARLSPTQKPQIIQAYQDSGAHVIMVGDGFNDVLALKVADVGIAMGKEGAHLARKSADLVLEDDDLGAVLVAIANGRAFYRNVRRSVSFLVTSSHTDCLIGLAQTSGLLRLGTRAWRSVWINLECLSLALESPPKHAADLPPIHPGDGLLTKSDMERSLNDAIGIISGAIPAGLYGAVQYDTGADAERLFLQSTTINELLFGLTCRERDGLSQGNAEPNPMLKALLFLGIGGHLAAAVLPGIGKPLVRSFMHVLDALILAHAGFLSQRFLAAPEHAHTSKRRRTGAG